MTLTSKLHFIKCINTQAVQGPLIVFIPGGPCFSSLTLRDLEPLKDTFDLVFLDPPGTGGTPDLNPVTYEGLLEDMEAALQTLNKPMILVGHSFGGIQAVEITVCGKLNVAGICVIASPFSQKTFEVMQRQYLAHRNMEMIQAEQAFEREQSEEKFLKMNIAYRPYYFSPATQNAGCELLKKDQSSFRAFLGATAAGQARAHLLDDLKKISIPKLFIAGESDLMFPPSSLELEAKKGGFDFHLIENAGHFVSFDQPEKTCDVIHDFFTASN